MDTTSYENILSGDPTIPIETPQLASITTSFSSQLHGPRNNSIPMFVPRLSPSPIPAPPNLWSPANSIRHATEPSQGYGRLRHLDRMKREQHILAAHEPLVMQWDMQDLSKIIEALESSSKGPQKQKKPWQDKRDEPASKFDPRAPHFDVVLIDLTNASEILHVKRTESDIDNSNLEDLGEAELSRKDGDRGNESHDSPGNSNIRGDRVRRDINNLSMESLAGRPGWLFLWVGTTENIPEGRRILGKFGFRKVECIGWMKTTNGTWDKVIIPEGELLSSEPTGNGVLRRGLEWCLVGVKGTAKRTYDSHLIHCNVSTDVLVCDGSCSPKSSLLSRIIENFSMGQRRLHLFAKPGDERPGWVCVGKDFAETTFDCRKYMRFWEEKGKHGWLMPFDAEIEYFRPKTPPLQVRKRERTGLGLSIATKTPHTSLNNRGKWEDDPPKFFHNGQRKRPVMRYKSPEDDPQNHNKFLVPISGNRGTDPTSESTQVPSQSLPKIRLNYQNSHVTQLRSASEPNLGTQSVQFHPSPSVTSFSPNYLSGKAQWTISNPTTTDIPLQKGSSVASSTAGDYYFLASGLIPKKKSDALSNDKGSAPKPYQQYLLQSSKPIKPSLPSSRIPSVCPQPERRNIPSNSTSNHPSHQSMSRSVPLEYSAPLEVHPINPHQSSHFLLEPREAKPPHSAVTVSAPISASTAEYRHNPPPGLYGSQSLGDTTSIIPTITQNMRRRSMPGVDFINTTGNTQHNVFQNGRRSMSTGDFPGQIHGIQGIQGSQYLNAQYLQVLGQNVPPTITHMGSTNPIIVPHQPVVYPSYSQHHGYQQQQQPIDTARQHINMQIQHLQLQQQHIRMQQHQIQMQQHQNHMPPPQQQQQQMANAYPAHQLHPQQTQQHQIQMQQYQNHMPPQQQQQMANAYPAHQLHSQETQQLQPQPQFGQYNANRFQY